MQARLERIVALLQGAQNAWAFTGAGVSTESGIPDFRSANDGLWQRFDPIKVASLEGFLHDTAGFYAFWQWRFSRLSTAVPNPTHRWLAALEAKGMLDGVITQNIDGLHRRAGTQTLYEVHGCYQWGSCIRCGQRYPIEEVLKRAHHDGHPCCDTCAGLLKPNVTLFGEGLPNSFYDALAALSGCDLLLVLGTSLEVFPAAEVVPQAKRGGAAVVLINAEPTPMDSLADVVIHGALAQVIERLSAAC